MDSVRILQIILILAFLGILGYLLRLYHALKLEKRIGQFAIVSKNDYEVSLFDGFWNFILKIIKKISKMFEKSEILKKYASHYQKYITYEQQEKYSALDYIAMKFMLASSIIILYIITCIFSYKPIEFFVVILLFCFGFFLIDVYLHILFIKKRKRIEEDLLKAIIIMNSAFQSGRSIMQAVEVVKNELDGPIQDEFKKIYLDITYGLSLEVVFERFYERVKIEDAKYITSSLSLLNKTGGDIIKVFSVIEKSIFQRKNLKNELQSLTSASRFVFKLLVALPLIFSMIIFILNPTYFKPLFTNPLGIFTFIIILSLYILYIIIIKKVLTVKI